MIKDKQCFKYDQYILNLVEMKNNCRNSPNEKRKEQLKRNYEFLILAIYVTMERNLIDEHQ